MYGNQLNNEVVQRGLLDLPAEIIQQINHNLPLQDEKRFREVCLGSPILRNCYKDEIAQSGLLKVDFSNKASSLKFKEDFNFIVNSKLEISLVFPEVHKLSKVQEFNFHCIEMICACRDRISQIEFSCKTPLTLLHMIKTEFLQLRKIKICVLGAGHQNYNSMFQELINNNSQQLEILELSGMRIISFNFNEMVKLIDLSFFQCTNVPCLLYQASNVKKITFKEMYFDPDTAITAKNLKNIETLHLHKCDGDISTLLTQVAHISRLELNQCKLNTPVKMPFRNLKSAKVNNIEIDVSGSSLCEKPGKLNELLNHYFVALKKALL